MTTLVTARITQKGLVINNRALSHTWSEKVYKTLLSKFTVTESVIKKKNIHKFAKSLRGFYRDNDDIIFPRMAPIFLPAFNKIVEIEYDTDSEDTDEIQKFNSIIPFYDYQQIGANHIVNLFETQHAAYAQLDTGMGKTLLAAAIFQKYNKKAVIVCMSLALVAQMITDFKAAFPEIKITHYDETKHPKLKTTFNDYDILVFVNISFSKRTESMDIFNNFKLLIIDEAHLYTSDTNEKILWQTQYFDNVLALSATPLGHPGKLDYFPLLFFGRPIEITKLENINIADSAFKVNVHKIEYFGDETKPWCANFIQGNMLSAVSTVGNISKDPNRNQMIANIVMDLRKRDHGVMIFSELREHLVRIQQYIKNAGIPSEISVLMSGVADDTLEIAKEYKEHVVLTTYGFSKVGISLSSMTSIILATPRRHGIAQVIGRILRKGSDETIVREIYDIVDMNIGLKSQYTTRAKTYKERLYPITTERIYFRDIKYDLKEEKFEEIQPDIDPSYSSFIDKLISETS